MVDNWRHYLDQRETKRGRVLTYYILNEIDRECAELRYQDELGSTSHIADGTGSIIESYQYDVYGKPRVYNASGVYQSGATPVANFLQGGARWMPELRLYDDRNRFMSPDLGRFIQPDPIGFKGDASNLYRYCGNDWANKTDPMGLEGYASTGLNTTDLTSKEVSSKMRDWNEKSFQEKLSAWETHMERGAPNAFTVEAGKAIAENVKAGNLWADNQKGDPRRAPALDREAVHEGRKAVDASGDYAAHHGEPTGYNVW